jgi:predicted RecB family nuclease
LPLPSYSLKVVEKYAGFQRTQDEYGGDWAMAKYIEATELEDAEARDEVMDEILKYNEEDLAATWHVLQWLKSKRK